MPEDFAGEFESINVADLPLPADFFESFFNGLGGTNVAGAGRGGEQ